MTQNNYREQMFSGLVQVIENTGKGDKSYDGLQKARDILEILELILANSILATSINKETIRESCEESYVNIRKIALSLYQEENQSDENVSPDLRKENSVNSSDAGGRKINSELNKLKKKSDFSKSNNTFNTY